MANAERYRYSYTLRYINNNIDIIRRLDLHLSIMIFVLKAYPVSLY